MRIALAQINPLVGDLSGNFNKIADYVERSVSEKADVLVFPELVLSGYPPEDLLFRQGFIEGCRHYLQLLAGKAKDIHLLVGFPRQENNHVYNSVAHLANGQILSTYDKQILPNYGVFDEVRYFSQGDVSGLIEIKGRKVGLTICEDIWQKEPAMRAVEEGAELIININASPYHNGKQQERIDTLRARCHESSAPIVYVNLVGGQDELVFDGHSFVVDAAGEKLLQMNGFEEQLAICDLDTAKKIKAQGTVDEVAETYDALVLAVRDYVRKNGFHGAVIGLSGGVDSALTLAIAADALGADQVEAVMMPSRYTSQISLDDAKNCAGNFSVAYEEISVEESFQVMLQSLHPVLADDSGVWAPDTTQENIQARCRGVILMAISNKKGKLVLATGNKSEMSVGYATLYGDMAGGFAPLKDVSKQRVYELCEYRNRKKEMIPKRILTRAPSAELAEDQKDEDSLPPYPVLDQILAQYLEQEKSVESIVASGFDESVVRDIVGKVNRNEYKRRQAAPGVKITRRALGRERRYPITSGYKF